MGLPGGGAPRPKNSSRRRQLRAGEAPSVLRRRAAPRNDPIARNRLLRAGGAARRQSKTLAKDGKFQRRRALAICQRLGRGEGNCCSPSSPPKPLAPLFSSPYALCAAEPTATTRERQRRRYSLVLSIILDFELIDTIKFS